MKKKIDRKSIASYGILTVIIAAVLSIYPLWYFKIRKPQFQVAVTFLESLKKRDSQLLGQVVEPGEFVTYKRLYLKNGYNKHLLHYDSLEVKETDGIYDPYVVRFSVLGTEDDIIFGKRDLNYVLTVVKKEGKWKVSQFASFEDYQDLNQIQRLEHKKRDRYGNLLEPAQEIDQQLK
ncbi:MAG: hypothetical protein ACE5GM_06485 [bacterium]